MDYRNKLTGITDADYTITGPAPKEERMSQNITYCERHRECRYDGEQCRHCVTELRAVYREAYMAALGGMPRVGMESNINFTGLVKEAHGYALETVRQWPAMMAELDKLIGEMG
jgi:hypothetical protein